MASRELWHETRSNRISKLDLSLVTSPEALELPDQVAGDLNFSGLTAMRVGQKQTKGVT